MQRAHKAIEKMAKAIVVIYLKEDNNLSSDFSIRNKISIIVCDSYFEGSRSLKGKIISELSHLKTDYLQLLQDVLHDKQDYITRAVAKKQAAGGFNTDYGKWRYIYSICGRLVKEQEQELVSMI